MKTFLIFALLTCYENLKDNFPPILPNGLTVRRVSLYGSGSFFKMKEIWSSILSYNGYYEVSNYGRIKALKRRIERVRYGEKFHCYRCEKIRSQIIGINGYPMVMLQMGARSKNLLVHRIVATAFIPNPDNKPQVNHKNGIKTDNRVENLEWVTAKENTTHAFEKGLRRAKRGMDSPLSINISQFTKDDIWIRDWAGVCEVERDTGLNKSVISACVRGKYKMAYGYIWKLSTQNKHIK